MTMRRGLSEARGQRSQELEASGDTDANHELFHQISPLKGTRHLMIHRFVYRLVICTLLV